MKLGTLVEWKIGKVRIAGTVIYLNGRVAQVIANGNTYEVEKKSLFVVPTCMNPACGKEITGRRRKRMTYCSHECAHAAQVIRKCVDCGRRTKFQRCQKCSITHLAAETDKKVFAALVEYKREHDGNTPLVAHLGEQVGYGQSNTSRSLNRLAKAGKIRFEGAHNHRSIIVVGARWVYEEQQP